MAARTLSSRIDVNPRVMMGKPVVRGTRIPVELIVKKFSRNISIEEVLREYPRLTREDVRAALAYAAEALGTEEVHWVKAGA